MKKKLIAMLMALVLAFCLGGCGKEETSDAQTSEESQETEDESVAAEEEEPVEEEITYTISCTADELMQEIVDDFDAAKEKYEDQYVEITGVLRECELDEDAYPVGKIVRLDTSLEIENAPCGITAITWDEDICPLEEFEPLMNELQPGDTVTIKTYIAEGDLGSGHDFYDFYFDLYGVEKQ